MNDLLDVWALVSKKFADARLLLVGYATPQNQKRFLGRQIDLLVNSNVVCAGVLSELDKWRALSESRVCLFLSKAEGWGLVPVEALSIGVPVVAYDLPCYRESLDGLYGVFRVPIGDIVAAAKQVNELIALDKRQYSDLTIRIRSTFRYRKWHEVANRELSLIEGGNATPLRSRVSAN
jgi:glycosyltransferase involved in cell wall biosynthesis